MAGDGGLPALPFAGVRSAASGFGVAGPEGSGGCAGFVRSAAALCAAAGGGVLLRAVAGQAEGILSPVSSSLLCMLSAHGVGAV